jgi:hypothetical protein
VKIFNYQYRWYSWLSQYSEWIRLSILFFPSLVLIFGWYFLYYNPMMHTVHELVLESQKSNKERIVFHELQNQILELEKEHELFFQEEKAASNNAHVYEKIFNALEQGGISVVEFQQAVQTVQSDKPISLTMKLEGPSDLLLKVFHTLSSQSIFFIVKSFDLNTSETKEYWTMHLQGEIVLK